MLMATNGLHSMHTVGIMHRDLKPSNLLITKDNEIKLADFGQARIFIDNKIQTTTEEKPKIIPSSQQFSLEVGTRWYKAPEILYGSREYAQKVDIWSLGCILAELLDHTPLFTGANDIDQLAKVNRILGPPDPSEDWYASVPEYARLNLPESKPADFMKYFSHRVVDESGR